MSISRDYLPFPRGSTATAGDTLIISQIGAHSTIQPLWSQANTGLTTGAGGPGQAPTANYPYPPFRDDLNGFIGDTTDTILGTNMPMQLRAVQYIPASLKAYLSLDGHAIGMSRAVGWSRSVALTIAASAGYNAVLPDPAYFVGRSNPVVVKPYDWFWAVEQGPALGVVGASLATSLAVMCHASSGAIIAATSGLFIIGQADGNGGAAATGSAYGYGRYIVPTSTTFVPGVTSVTDGSVTTAGTVLMNHAIAIPSGITSGTAAGNLMPSGSVSNTSPYALVWVRPMNTGQCES